jgi:hypothetical protein
MAVVQIPNLPGTIALSGAELIEVVQNGVSQRCSISQIAALVSSFTVGAVTQKQIRGWLANNGVPAYIYTVDAECPADIADAVNIQWLHGNTMVQGDPLYVFIETTLGFTAFQMATAFQGMGTYPV